MSKTLFLRFYGVVILLLPWGILAQSTIVTWPLTSDFTTVNYNSNDLDNAAYSHGTGIVEWAISNYDLGGDWYDFTANAIIEEADYVQFELSPKTGLNAKNIYISGLELEMLQITWFGFSGPRNYRIDYSKSIDFSTYVTAATGSIITSFTVNDIQFLSPLEVFSGETIYFRIYGYNSENYGDLIIRKSDFTVKGYIEAATNVNPVPALDFTQDCANTANLQFNLPAGFNSANETILIFAKAGSPINYGVSTALLSSYPNADNNLTTFSGSPYQHDANAKLVYRGTSAGPQQLTNVTSGVTYYFVAFNFLTPGGSGNISAGTFASGSVTGSIPDVIDYLGIATSTMVNLSFTTPNCVDAVMIVTKEGVINGIPTGDGSAYNPDPDFLGAGTPFDGGKVVYNSTHTSGSAGAVSVTNLTNEISYNFKAFVRKGTSWSPGIEITATPDISSIIFTQIQSRGSDFLEFMTLTRMDISKLNITDQGVCASGAVFQTLSESAYENFFNSTGNSDITTPLTDVPAGTFVHVYSGDHTIDLDYTDGLIVLRNSGLSFDQNGDQALVFTGQLPGLLEDCGALPNPISAGIDFASSSGWITSGTPDENTSYKPDTPAAFETLNTKPNSRYKNSTLRGDSTVIFAAMMDQTKWQHQNKNTDYWRLKQVQFQASDYITGDIVFDNIAGDSFDLDASGLSFLETSGSTRYMVIINEAANPDAPVNRYTCYTPDTNYELAPDVVTSITKQFNLSLPCGETQTTGIGKVVYLDYLLPSALTITRLKCTSEYRVFVYAINGNGATMKHGTRRRGIVTTTENATALDTYYSRGNGDFSDNIWADTPTGTPTVYPDLQPCLKLIIQNGNTITMDVDASLGEIEVEAGGLFDLNGMTLALQKNFIIDGTVNSNADLVIFNGTAGIQVLQTATETEFFDIEVNKTSVVEANDLAITGDIAIRNTVAITAGNLSVDPGFSLRLISDQADRAAALTTVPALSTVTGNFIVERYLPAITTTAPPNSGAGVGWRYLAAPVKNATYAEITDDFICTGFTGSQYPNYLSYGHYFPNLQKYDESVSDVQSFGFDGDFYDSPNNNPLAAPLIRNRRDITEPINPGEGIFAYIGPVEATFDFEGEPNTGDVNLALAYTDHSLPNEDGWHMVANPYPCAIDWALVSKSAGVSPFAYIYNAMGTGNFVVIDANAAGPQLIASANAFWVKTSQASSITFEEINKSSDVTANFYKGDDPELNELFIFLENVSDTSMRDQTQIRLNEKATTTYDFEFDAYKRYSFNPSVPGVSTQIDSSDHDFAINTIGLGDSTLIIPLKANIRIAGDYKFTFDISGDQLLNYCLVLRDNLTATEVTVASGVEYTFLSETNIVEDSARFMLILTPTIDLETFDAVCFGGFNGEVVVNIYNTEPVNYELFDADGETVTSGVGQDEFLIGGLSWGFYELELSGLSGACPVISRELFIGQPAAVPNAEVTAYDALCKDSNDGEVFVSWEDSSFYQLYLFKDDVLVEYIVDASLEYSIQDLEQGIYDLNISNACDTVFYQLEINNIDSMELDFILPEDTIYLQDGGYVFYQNISKNGFNFQWGFNPDQEAPIDSENGEFTYTDPGTYNIVLAGISAEGCNDFVVKQITVIDLASTVIEIDNLNDHFVILYAPDHIVLDYRLEKESIMDLSVYDGLGRIYYNESLSANKQGKYAIPSAGLAPGIYFIRIDRKGEKSLMLRFVVRG